MVFEKDASVFGATQLGMALRPGVTLSVTRASFGGGGGGGGGGSGGGGGGGGGGGACSAGLQSACAPPLYTLAPTPRQARAPSP